MTTVSNIQSGEVAAPVKTPTQRVVEDANRVAYGMDALGRKLGVVRITASLRRRVLKALSAESGEKNGLLVMAVLACACVEIDGRMLPFPRNEIQIDAQIDLLEQEGLNAVGEILAREWAESEDKAEDLKNS